MIRLYNTQAKLVILALQYLQRTAGLNGAAIATYFRDSYRDSKDGDHYLFAQYGKTVLAEGETDLKAVAEILQEQQNKGPEYDADLVETIVAELGLEFARNRGLGGGSLDAVRRALLLPDEFRKLKDKLKGELACPHCRHRFQDGECLTVSIDRSGAVLNCFRCRLPVYVACSKGKGGEDDCVAKLDERDVTRIRRQTCYAHTEKKADGTAVEPDINEALSGGRRAGRSAAQQAFRDRIRRAADLAQGIRFTTEPVDPGIPQNMPHGANPALGFDDSLEETLMPDNPFDGDNENG